MTDPFALEGHLILVTGASLKPPASSTARGTGGSRSP